eukprot:GAHX01000513.1.p1 GENE.GAHX01000513.1~~GAHX01000513.1.p1  ORF type:complete len:401 (-),score=66.36 GAHX01000513.1:27-1229(-)
MKEVHNRYADEIKKVRETIAELEADITRNRRKPQAGTGLAPFSDWNIHADKLRHQQEQPLQVAKILQKLNRKTSAGKELYMIEITHMGKHVVVADQTINPDDIEEGMRVGVERLKYTIKVLLPSKIDSSVRLMEIEDKPAITYEDVGGCEEQLEKIREIVELPMTDPSRFSNIGVEPPKGVLLYGPPGTGKTLLAKAVANRTNASFIRVIGSELVQKYVGEGSRMVREIFKLARSKPATILFLDEIDAVGGTRSSDGDNDEVQRTMLQLLTELDGFSARGNIKVIMATNRPDTLDPALMRPGRIDRKIEFGLPTIEGRREIFEIHSRKMAIKEGIRWELLARLCPNASGAELRSICTEAGMFAIRDRKRAVCENDFVKAVNKVTKEYARFSSTPQYMIYN